MAFSASTRECPFVASTSLVTRTQVYHTNASLLIAQGVDVRTVASLLGHSQASTTLDIYAHAFDKKTGSPGEAG